MASVRCVAHCADLSLWFSGFFVTKSRAWRPILFYPPFEGIFHLSSQAFVVALMWPHLVVLGVDIQCNYVAAAHAIRLEALRSLALTTPMRPFSHLPGAQASGRTVVTPARQWGVILGLCGSTGCIRGELRRSDASLPSCHSKSCDIEFSSAGMNASVQVDETEALEDEGGADSPPSVRALQRLRFSCADALVAVGKHGAVACG